MPRDPNTLSQERLAEIVVCIQATLWFDDDADRWDKDREWDPDTIEAVADQLIRAGLRPEEGICACMAQDDQSVCKCMTRTKEGVCFDCSIGTHTFHWARRARDA